MYSYVLNANGISSLVGERVCVPEDEPLVSKHVGDKLKY
jgi:hypothetical protein